MAALFVVLAAYAALDGRVGWSTGAWALALLCKENAAVLPALVAFGWMTGLARPTRARLIAFGVSWVVVGAAYAGIRAMILQPYGAYQSVAPMFLGVAPGTVRLTAIAALADVARLLVFPLTLRADYSPAERTLVTSVFDPRLALGVACLVGWAALLVLAWRKGGGRRVESLGLGWVAIAFLPVANLLFPAGFLVAERTLYLPSVGVALAAAAWLARIAERRLVPIAAAVVLLGAVRTVLRVPVWRDNLAVTTSIIEDSPQSYVGPKRMMAVYLNAHQPARALAAARIAAQIHAEDPAIYSTGAVAAFAAGEPRAADSMLAALNRMCPHCAGYYQREAATARAHGYAAAADSLLARARGFDTR
jgi:hypothetical protein